MGFANSRAAARERTRRRMLVPETEASAVSGALAASGLLAMARLASSAFRLVFSTSRSAFHTAWIAMQITQAALDPHFATRPGWRHEGAWNASTVLETSFNLASVECELVAGPLGCRLSAKVLLARHGFRIS